MKCKWSGSIIVKVKWPTLTLTKARNGTGYRPLGTGDLAIVRRALHAVGNDLGARNVATASPRKGKSTTDLGEERGQIYRHDEDGRPFHATRENERRFSIDHLPPFPRPLRAPARAPHEKCDEGETCSFFRIIFLWFETGRFA
ncbi:hypothetical protein GWI33_011992 [Rhynchophorus ferrugineus]|uniref:Uncharacterized protein n=1 Tax=Rhynchophorus ferrugineus TaxID=354439 RepID=A0A834ISD5_RHYFE|nr:hypothetical protein GWI33_011992 [Rhynchophorus ferrugineus]